MFHKVTQQLTPEQIQSIHDYTHGYAYPVNDTLRFEDVLPDQYWRDRGVGPLSYTDNKRQQVQTNLEDIAKFTHLMTLIFVA